MSISNSSFTPTPEQQAIFAAFASSAGDIIIDAKAGAGKSSTLLAGIKRGLLRGSSLGQAFNKAIADEMNRGMADAPLTVKAQAQFKTVHAHGLAALKRAGLSPQVQGGKLSFLLRDVSKTWRDDDPAQRNTRHISKLASMAKNAGFGLEACDGKERFPALADKQAWHDLVEHFNLDMELEHGFTAEALVEEAIDLLLLSNKKLGMIDFDDMVYLPLLGNLGIAQFDNILIDEAQDINATRRELAFRSRKPGGRIIAVGDPHQAIYGFTGASTDSLDAIARRCEQVTTLPLSTCWRCDDAILDKARLIVPTIRTSPAKIGKGTVDSVAFRDEASHEDFLALPKPGDVILCRLNKPNVATALGLLRRGTPARIEGKDIGRKLVDHYKAANDAYAFATCSEMLHDLAAHRDLESAKLAAKNREAAAELLKDEVDAAILIAERAIELKPRAGFVDFEAQVMSLFADDVPLSGLVLLSSVHKFKGREAPHVYILGRYDYMPFWKAEPGWQLEQEYNLIYVAETRAQNHLTYVTGVQSALDKQLHRLPALKVPA